MLLLDWFFIGLLSGAILISLFALLVLSLSFITNKKEKQLRGKRSKNKRKNKKIKRERYRLKVKKKKQIRSAISLVVLAILLAGGAWYTQFYQKTNLAEEDAANIVQGYYLLSEVEKQIESVKDTANVEKTSSNLRELSAKIASFGIKSANGRLTIEGQQILNRYYIQMKELGLNLNNQSVETLRSEEVYTEYVENLNKVKKIQKKVITYFKVNEAALKNKK
ncbi:hypothetical protein A5821_002044 [Enterococcus sp. 7F3_DIV0205]|uniref:Uncharacterized protein n=1 Tax=Candidatus Enterococcus palustris TaxID=1834189 RepID=A0AAQ3W983_9ENTE|nr:hypothetical protein [Enterococcus sp. 7F3_DIV0205]OTN82483.1 hypothetical protein A5821_002394 [Enterococcus sp. 7F3_DIV0205]